MLEQRRTSNALNKRMGIQEAKTQGPTLGEFASQWMDLLALRGLWLMGVQNNAGLIQDMSGTGNPLVYNGNPVLNVYNELVPYEDYDGTGDFHSVADNANLDITGGEGQYAAAIKGLTLGGWFWMDAFAANDGLITKGDAASAAGSAYNLDLSATGVKLDLFSGAAGVSVASAALNTGQWYFVVGRYTPSTEAAIWTNGTKVVNTTSIPATLNNVAAPLNIANTASGVTRYLDGRCAMAFLCAARLSDNLIDQLFARSRPFFQV